MAGLSSKSGFLRRHCVFERLESRTLLATVAGRFIAHDDPSSAGAFDIATDKQPLFPGEAATFANYTSDVRGIRRLVIDLAGRSNASALLASDFQFRMGNDSHFTNAAAAPLPFITTRNHAGDDGSDRVTLTWEPADLRNTWLEVTIHPTRRTELSGSDVFYFGNAVGETGDSLRHAVVNVVDEDLVRQHAGSGRGNVDARFDFNRDHWVDGSDVAIARDFRTNFATSLALIAPPAPETSQPSRIHYDYPIDKKGTLDGGFIIADQSDPLQQNVVSRPSARHTPRHPSTTLVSHGPSDNRIDLVFVGDGYTAAQMPSYASHVNSIYPTFFNEAPLDEYYSYFNIHRVDVASLESGVDNDPTQGVQKNTALDMAFWCAGTERLLCINTSKASLAARSAPAVDQILAVANSTMYGGAGYASNNLGTLSGANAAAIEVALHEFGHSFADLADEYFYTGTTYYGGEPSAPNVSKLTAASMAAQQKKWHRWLDEPNVSTFEGAMYNEKGLYRPTSNSKMRTLGRPFEQVNTEQFVLSVYKTVDPIDGATAPGSYQDGHVFFVDPMDPMSHRLDVQWYLDGSPIDGATAETLDTSTLTLPAGSYSLSVQVVDNTAMVRDESQRTALMTETRTWTLVSTQAGVVARHVFYNKSVFDNHTRGPDPADDLAIDNSKAPLLPGGTASFGKSSNRTIATHGCLFFLCRTTGMLSPASFVAWSSAS